MTIGAYLIQQLYDHGIRHVFGIPGDYSLAFIDALVHSPITFVNTCDEQGAGFAADAYARLGGLGAVCVTYAVGSLKVANATAQAYAERSPLVILCGSPGLQERVRHPLLHHRVNQYDTQLNIFRHLTVATAVLDDAETAFSEIDRVLHAAMRHQRPVYLELPRDQVDVPGLAGHTHQDEVEVSDPDALDEALREATTMLSAARRPVIIGGVEVKRFGLQETLVRFAERVQVPIAVTMQGKSLVRDAFPLYLGLYAGAIGARDVAEYVESSDCLLVLGTPLTDISLGFFTAKFDREKMIAASMEGVSIRHHSYDVRMGHFMDGLLAANIPRKSPDIVPRPIPAEPFTPAANQPITTRRLFQRLAASIDETTIVLADIGDALFGALDFPTRTEVRFLASADYSNMGFAVPGSLGAQLQNRALRPLVLAGDGSFQMTGVEISTAARYGLSPIIVVLNNQGYATERFFLDGPFNEILNWDYSRLPAVLGAGKGYAVTTEEELDTALHAALADPATPTLLDVRLARGDVSDCLQKLGEQMGKTVYG